VVLPSLPSQYDTLTHALTRTSGEAFLREHLQAQPQAPVAVLFLDIDHFKSINDAFGHEAGDQALKFVTSTIQNLVKHRGKIARYGGDEFFVILPHTDLIAAQKIAQEILDHFQHHVVLHTHPLHLRLSIGIAVAPKDGTQVNELLRAADRRHYFAKHGGGHRVVATDRISTRELITIPRRPLGQREQLTELHHYMGELLHLPSGVIRIQSPPHGGARGFLNHAHAIANLQGYVVIPIEATPTLHLRYLGAFSEALSKILPPETYRAPETSQEVVKILRQWLAEHHPHQGVLFTVGNAEWLDEASINTLQHLLTPPRGFERVVLIYATVSQAKAAFRAPFFASITLPPLDFHAVEAWLRHALRWDPPPDCTQWIWRNTQGLPGLLHPTLEALIQEGFLIPLPDGWQWHHPKDWEPPAIEAAPALPDVGVPSDIPLLIGRNAALQKIHQTLTHAPLLTVTGAGGIGKTRLLQQLALESADAFSDGVYFISLENATDAHLPALLAQALQPMLLPHKDIVEQIIAHLKVRHTLLVLDGFEHVLSAAPLLSTILNAAPQNRIVVGSRQRLHLPLEHAMTLPGLSLHASDEQASPAALLFSHLARRSGASFQHKLPIAPIINDICQWAGGSPMALSIVASWSTVLSPQEILDRLHSGQQTDNPLDTALDAFWSLLSESEQKQLAQLSLFQGSFESKAARHVAGVSPFFLDALSTKTYLKRDNAGHFHTHPLLRQFARQHLSQLPELEAQSLRRHAEWYLQYLPQEAGITTETERWSFVANEIYLSDAIAAWRWALQQQDAALLLKAAPWLLPSLGTLNRFVETHALITDSIETLRAYPPKQRDATYFVLRSYLEISKAEFYYHLGEYNTAHHVLRRVHRRMMPFLPLLHQAYLLTTMARLETVTGDYEKARYLFQQAHAIYTHLHASQLLFSIQNSLGVIAYTAGNLEAAQIHFREALAMARESGNTQSIVALLNNLGNLAWYRGNYDEADALLDEALHLFNPNKAPSLASAVLDSAGKVKCALRKPREALKLLNEAIRYAQRSGSRPNVLIAAVTVARVWKQINRLNEAASLLATVLQYDELPNYYHDEARQLLSEISGPIPPKIWETQDLEALARRVLGMNYRFFSTITAT